MVRIYSSSRCRSDGAQIVRRGLAAPSVSNNIKRDLLSLVEPRHSGSFDRADVDEDVLAAIIRLDEAEAFSEDAPPYKLSPDTIEKAIDALVVKPKAAKTV